MYVKYELILNNIWRQYYSFIIFMLNIYRYLWEFYQEDRTAVSAERQEAL
ncbi:hypothetical protein SAMN05661099_0411 [Daejeonella lutea]|uniref:Uncharacterized protein n=1 Tax=Daejeonella lutea TaxID=572036 RepID=A0A1T5A7R1_9SPHI|nr:hypothetical protein SAMN05661099_0411 [Daejeonella lutea]